MAKIVLYNIILFVVLSFCSIGLIYKYFMAEKVDGALMQLAAMRENPHYNRTTQKIGNLPKNKAPTNYLKIKVDPEKIKIGFFGDSNTMGSEVNPGDAFPAVLQSILGEEYQVINFGQGGYNSNQVYLMAKYFSKKFNLDIIVIGPRGFYIERATTFNNYWNQGSIPYSRFILKNNELKEVSIPGDTMEDQISNYYSIIPRWNLIQHDHVAPSFLKLFDILFEKEILNPFFTRSRNSNVRLIQIKQLEDLSESYSKPVIHYTDFSPDCEEFKKVRTENYKLYCAKPFVHKFPYQAQFSHPSSFGHYRHAKNIENILLKRSMNDENILFKDDETLYETTMVDEMSDQSIELDNLGAFIGGKNIAKLGKIWGYQDTTGRLQTYNHNDETDEGKKYFLLGFYLEGTTRANSLFIRIKATKKNINLMKGANFERIKGISNIFFLKVPGVYIYHPKNKIYFSKEWVSNFPVLSFFVKSHEEKYISYKPKYPSYKMIIDKNISAFKFFEKVNRNKTKIVIGKIE